MNTLQTFFFANKHRVRTVIEDGQIRFVASDVVAALGLDNPSKATKSLQEDEKGITIADTPGGRQTVITITESGLYALVFKSRRIEAQAFRRWVTGEVLPAIRQTGTYSLPQAPAFALPQTYAEALRALADSTEANERLQATVQAQAPAVEFVGRFVASEGLFGIRETAKLLGIPQNEFVELCQTRRVLFRENGHLQPYAEHLKAGYFAVKAGQSNDHAFTQTRFTSKGIEWLRRHLSIPALSLFAA